MDPITDTDFDLDTPPPGCPAPCPILDDVTDLPYSLSVEEPDSRRWVVTAEEKERIERASHWGRTLVLEARAGNRQALDDLRTRMHVTEWKAAR